METRDETQAVQDGILPEFVKTREAAAILRVSTESLRRYRIRGGGPAYYVFGTSIVYALADLADWAAGQRYLHTGQFHTDQPGAL